MAHPRFLSISAQVAAYLRGELGRGRWSGAMPGLKPLAAELGINEKTAGLALRQLEREGVLIPQGLRRKRLIEPAPAAPAAPPSLRLAILPTEESDRRLDYVIKLQHHLEQSGHSVIWPQASLAELRMDVKRVARLVKRTPADAWVVFAASRELLEWFSTQALPVLALFGRRRGLPLAGVGPDKVQAYVAATRALIALGHRRIVLLARPRRRLPEPGGSEQAFLDELAAHGIKDDAYHLPHWEDSIADFHENLEALFRFTPPTALIIQEVPLFVAAQQFLLHRGIRVPEEVSLVCTDADPNFDWCRPTVAHMRWDSGPVVRRVVRWAANVSHGRQDLRQTLTPAEFVPGGTIGPAAQK